MSSSLAFTLELHYASCEKPFASAVLQSNCTRWYKVQQADTQQLWLGVVGLKQVSSSFCCSSSSIECSLARSVQIKLKSRRRVEPYMYGESTVQPTKLFSRQRNKKNVYALSQHAIIILPKLPCAICRKNVDLRDATSDRAI